jgi:hypothetical protein
MHPDSLVTLAQARMIWRDVPAATWRRWACEDRKAWRASIDAAQVWWQARCARETDAWSAWVASGWDDEALAEVPTLAVRVMAEHGMRRGETVYRLGDLHALVRRREDESRPGPRVTTPYLPSAV